MEKQEEQTTNESLTRDIAEQFEVGHKFQVARKFVVTTISYYRSPSILARMILGEEQKSYARPVSYFCTSLLLCFTLVAFFGESRNDHKSKIDEMLEEFALVLFFLIMIVPGASVAHLLLRGRGRKVRHMVYVQCYAVTIHTPVMRQRWRGLRAGVSLPWRRR